MPAWMIFANIAWTAFEDVPAFEMDRSKTSIDALANQIDAESQYILGSRYAVGAGVPKDQEEALRLFRRAAECGHMVAQYNAGVFYDRGVGTPTDHQEALRWYLKAAAQGHIPAHTNIGVLYFFGRGVHKDYEEALKWFEYGAQRGNGLAQAKLGRLYENGQGVPQDLVQAYYWYELSAQQHTPFAATLRNDLAKKMTPSQVLEAKKTVERMRRKSNEQEKTDRLPK